MLEIRHVNKFDPKIHRRRSIRLPHYDYSNPGAYFVTMCTQKRECIFGQIVDGNMRPNECGRVVESAWNGLPARFSHVELDAFIIMPNHFHGIIILAGEQSITLDDTRSIEPIGRDESRPYMRRKTSEKQATTLGKIVRAFKATTTRTIRSAHFDKFAWQRNYYEHVVRNEDDLNSIREYITYNPLRWADDENNPQNLQGRNSLRLKCPISTILPGGRFLW